MRIKKFVLTNIFFSVILLSSLYSLSLFYINYVNDETVKFMEYNKIPDKSVDIVTLGSSHARFGIKLNEKNEMNLGVNSQYFYYDLLMLKKYENKIKRGAVIILPVSIFSFYNNNDKKIDSRYVNIFKREKLQNNVIKKSEYFFRKNFSILFPVQNLIKLGSFLEKKKLEKNYLDYPNNKDLKKRMILAEETAKRHLGIESIYHQKNGVEDFKKIVNYVEEKEYKLILVTTPFTYLYNDNIEKFNKNAYFERIKNNILFIEKSMNKKFIYLDYSHDKRFEGNLEYFFDDNHLNREGAEYFTEILLNDIKINL